VPARHYTRSSELIGPEALRDTTTFAVSRTWPMNGDAIS
jgi:hypothetical protein